MVEICEIPSYISTDLLVEELFIAICDAHLCQVQGSILSKISGNPDGLPR